MQAGAGAPAVREMEIDPKNATLRVLTSIETKEGAGVLVFEPSMDEEKNISWACSAEGIMRDALPEDCR